MGTEQDTQPELKCWVCGKKLVGRQTKFCSPEHRIWYYNNRNGDKKRDYYKDYMGGYRKAKKNEKYCFYCGIKLGKYKRRFCSRSHRELYYKRDRMLHENVVKTGVLPRGAPDYCDECGGKVILESNNEYVCTKCGLVY